MNNKLLKLIVLPGMIAVTALTGCEKKSNVQKGEDIYHLIPESVCNYKGTLDALIYIEGQNGTITDIGNPKRTADELNDAFLARFAAAAREFRKIAPNVKINVSYTSIGDYQDAIIDYVSNHGHLPHIMHNTYSVYEVMQMGYATDLTPYANSELYKSYDKSILEEFKYGNFQGGFPYMIYPIGVFVNKSLLNKQYIDIQELLDNYTLANFIDVCKRVTDFSKSIAAMPHIQESFVSYAAPTIYKSYKQNRTVQLNTREVEDLIELEAQFPNVCGYRFNPTNYNQPQPGMTEIQDWNGNKDFIENDKFAFTAEVPWNLGLLSSMATKVNREADFDYLPFPSANEDTENHVGMIAEALTIGNQCPIDNDGNPKCVKGGQAATDAAVYFTMFMTADPRSMEARSNIEWTLAQVVTKGVLDMPMVDKNFKFSYQTEEEEVQFKTQLRRWFECYSTWYDRSIDPVPDVDEYTNIKPGFKQVLDLFYSENGVQRINFNGIPSRIPNETGGTTHIMNEWCNRYLLDKGATQVIYPNWVSILKSKLADMEKDIRENAEAVWAYFQNQLDLYYGKGRYNVLEIA